MKDDNISARTKEKENQKQSAHIIDGDSAVFGRLASTAAKSLIEGQKVIILNVRKAIITGNKKFIKDKFLHRRQRGDNIKGPFYPRYPDDMLKRAIRGMIPYKKPKGRLAMRRLKIYIDCPKEFIGKAKKLTKTKKDLECRFMTLGEVSKFLGAKI